MRLLLILLSPSGTRGPLTAVKLAEAALRRGYQGIIFCTGDGVENLRRGTASPLAARLTRLIRGGARLMVCRESARRRGLLKGAGLMKGVEISSLGGLVELMDSSERALVFG